MQATANVRFEQVSGQAEHDTLGWPPYSSYYALSAPWLFGFLRCLRSEAISRVIGEVNVALRMNVECFRRTFTSDDTLQLASRPTGFGAFGTTLFSRIHDPKSTSVENFIATLYTGNRIHGAQFYASGSEFSSQRFRNRNLFYFVNFHVIFILVCICMRGVLTISRGRSALKC